MPKYNFDQITPIAGQKRPQLPQLLSRSISRFHPNQQLKELLNLPKYFSYSLNSISCYIISFPVNVHENYLAGLKPSRTEAKPDATLPPCVTTSSKEISKLTMQGLIRLFNMEITAYFIRLVFPLLHYLILP